MKFTTANQKTSNLIGSKRRAKNRAQKKQRLIAKFNDYLTSELPIILSQDKDCTISKIQVDGILNWISTQQLGLEQKKICNNYLSGLLRAGREQKNWSCPEVPLMLSLPRDKNFLTPIQFIKLPLVRDSVALFNCSLQQTYSFEFRDKHHERLYLWGQILVSAVVNGGLLSTKSLVALLNCPNPKLFKNFVWVTLFKDESPEWLKAKGQRRQWFVDPTTLLLLKKIHSKKLLPIQLPTFSESVDWALRAVNIFYQDIARLNHQSWVNQTSLALWLEQHQVRTSLILPSYLLNYASSREASTALSDHGYLRLTHGKYSSVIAPQKSDEIQPLQETKVHNSQRLSLECVRALDGEVREILYRNHDAKKIGNHHLASQLNGVLKKYQGNIPEILEALLTWLLYKIQNHQIVRSTAYEYYTSMVSSLLHYLSDGDLDAYSIEQFIGTYEEILDGTSGASTKLGLAQRLNQLHRHLVINYHVSPIDFKVMDDDCFVTSADANMLTSREYRNILSQMEVSCNARQSKAIRCMFVLAYRCGLRINEVVNLRFADVQTDLLLPFDILLKRPATLLIQNNAYNKLKTTESRRILPLYLLIPPNELALVLKYLSDEFQFGNLNGNRFIFAVTPNATDRICRSSIYGFINPYLRSQTKDGNFRFHHLRHSFVNNLMLALLCSRKRLDMLYDFDHFYFLLKDALLRDGIYQRSFLFQIAEWAGHTSPKTTLNSYTHVLDFLLFDALYEYSYSLVKRGLGICKEFYSDLDVGASLAHQLDLEKDQLIVKINKQLTSPQFIANRGDPLPDSGSNLKQHLTIPAKWKTSAIEVRPFSDLNLSDWIAIFQFKKRNYLYVEIFEMLGMELPDLHKLDDLFFKLFKARKNLRFKQSALVSQLQTQEHHLEFDPRKIVYLPTTPRGQFANTVASTIYDNVRKMYAIKPDSVQKLLKLYIQNFNFAEREIRFPKQNQQDIAVFVDLLKKILPDEILVHQDNNKYQSSDRYVTSIKLYSNDKARCESSFAVRFAILCVYLTTQIGK